MNPSLYLALTSYIPITLPEAVLGVMACVLFLGGTWKASRHLWGTVSLIAIVLAGLAFWPSIQWMPTGESIRSACDAAQAKVPNAATPDRDALAHAAEVKEKEKNEAADALFVAPVQQANLTLLVRVITLLGGAVLILISWNEISDAHAADYYACLLLIFAGTGLVAAANELVTLFLALELVSIPTYVLLYLTRDGQEAQEAAMKYFLLSVFSSGLLLFGFSYLYGMTGTTNIPAIADALGTRHFPSPLPGLALVALVMIVAGLGFRIAAVPFHFYAPDVFQGTSIPAAAMLAFIPKVVGFVALLRVLGYAPSALSATRGPLGLMLGEQVPLVFFILAAVTMSLGNVLALLQNNVKRLLAYSSVAHAGYMLIGLAVAPKMPPGEGAHFGSLEVTGVDAVLFYLIAYSAMTIGSFSVLTFINSKQQPVETVDDMAGLGKTRPGIALLMCLFLFSLIGIPLTAGFNGKLLLFVGALGLPVSSDGALEQKKLYIILAVIGAINAAIGGWYYLRIAAMMFLREPTREPSGSRSYPALAAVWICAFLTLAAGVYPGPFWKAVRASLPSSTSGPPQATLPHPALAAAD